MPGAVAPAASCAANAQRKAHEIITGTTEHTPALPAQWATAYTRSPRSAGLVSLRRLKIITSGLTPASGRQDHATSPSASRAARLAAPMRPSQPASRFVTIGRNVPPGEAGWRQDNHIFPKNERRIFLREGLDTISENQPSGKSGRSSWGGQRRSCTVPTISRPSDLSGGLAEPVIGPRVRADPLALPTLRTETTLRRVAGNEARNSGGHAGDARGQRLGARRLRRMAAIRQKTLSRASIPAQLCPLR